MAFDCVEVPAGRGKHARACSVRGCDRPYRAKGLSWVMKHRDDPFLHRLFDEARKRGVRHGPGPT